MENDYVLNGRFRFTVFILACIVILSVISCAVYVYSCTEKLRNDISQNFEPKKSVTNAGDIRPAMYTVKELNGRIGIWSRDGNLAQMLDITVSSLPKADRELLRKGFDIYSMSEFSSVIEDYTG